VELVGTDTDQFHPEPNRIDDESLRVTTSRGCVPQRVRIHGSSARAAPRSRKALFWGRHMIRASELSDWFTRKPHAVHNIEAIEFRGERRHTEIIDFIGGPNWYTDSFGVQWRKYRYTQIDRYNGTTFSHGHLNAMTFDEPQVFNGQTVLEIGSGAGRYTDHLVDRAAQVISVDPSAIGINVALGAPNLIPVRGDLFDLPVRREMIDVVFCRGVVQHTGNTRRAIKRLFDYVKPGGTVLFDVYSLKWFTPFYAKYWIRPLTRRISTQSFIPFAEKWVPRLLRIKRRYVMPLLPNNKLGAKIAAQIVPIADFTSNTVLTPELRIEWSVLDTVDMYTPRYDRPMSWNGVMKTLRCVGAREIRGDYGLFCFKATAPS